VLILFAGAGAPAPAGGEVVFMARPASQPLYATSAAQPGEVSGDDGVTLYYDLYRPAAKGTAVPPERSPVVLVISPYETAGVLRARYQRIVDHLTARGYAVVIAHSRGTGASSGCFDRVGTAAIRDAEALIAHATGAPFSTGAVGMYGYSYQGDVQVAVAGMGNRARIAGLRAIVPGAVIGGGYEVNFQDGVERASGQLYGEWYYNTAGSVTALTPDTPARHVPDRLTCLPAHTLAAVDDRGNYSAHWADRDYRAAARRITVPTLLYHGFADVQLDPSPLFDLIPDSTPKHLVTGWWEHVEPDGPDRSVHPEWSRDDWLDVVTAWYDHWLKGADTRVDSWPEVQVQASDGRWRVERSWPDTGVPAHLPLGPAGMGRTGPAGSTSSYTEALDGQLPATGSQLRLETPPLPGRLHLTGRPVLDAWVVLDRPDAHLSARLDVVAANGTVQQHHSTVGLRSAQHLDAMPEGVFRQTEQRLPATGQPLRVVVRFDVTDLVVEAGQRLRLTLAGTVRNEFPAVAVADDPLGGSFNTLFEQYTQASGTQTTVTVLHDCTHPSALRFYVADPDSPRLRIAGQPAPAAPGRAPTDGGGLTTQPLCGQAPLSPTHVERS
jgi:predicted acyl esterase